MFKKDYASRKVKYHETWDKILLKNKELIQTNIPKQLLIVPRFASLIKTNSRLTKFLPTTTLKLPLSEILQICVRTEIHSHIVDTLNKINKRCIDLGKLWIDYEINSHGLSDHSIPKADRNSKTTVSLGNNLGYLLNKANINEFLNESEIHHGFFRIILSIKNIADKSHLGHDVIGYVNKTNQTIYVYDGASLINFSDGLKYLSKFLHEKFPGYKQKLILRAHQNKYKTCAIFQPIVGFLMALYDDPLLVINLFDKLNGKRREAIVDSIVMSINEFVKSQEDKIKIEQSSSTNKEASYVINI